jgi:dienelactone hydrolase
MKTPPDSPQLPDFFEIRRKSLRYELGFSQWRGDFSGWRAALAGLWHDSLPPHQSAASGTLTKGRVSLRYATGAQAEGVLLLPEGPGPHPAVLVLHDHGGDFTRGWRKLAQDPDSAASRARHYDGAAPLEALRAAGFAVLCLDALGWGGRQIGGYEAQQALAANALHLGWSLAGLVAAEDVQAAAWLASRPEIDAGRIGAWGFSWGGFRAWQVAALSPRIRAAAALSWMAQRAGLMIAGGPYLRGQSAFWMLHPALSAKADFPDMAGLAAGKPLFFRSGRSDPHMPEVAVQPAFDNIAAICAAAGGPAADVGFFDGGHACPAGVQTQALSFLAAVLK